MRGRTPRGRAPGIGRETAEAMEQITVAELLEELSRELELTLAGGSAVSPANVVSSDVSRPGLVLAGFHKGFHADRIQVLGEADLAYLESLGREGAVTALERLCAPTVPCVIVTSGQEIPRELAECASAKGIPVLVSALPTETFVRELGARLDELLAPETAVQGTLVDVYGMGLLLTGKSGIGKSECALDLVEQGHRLVADDVISVRRTPQGYLVGSRNDILRHYMEIRGIGIIDVRAMFGVRAIRARKRIEVEVRLTAWSELDDYERLGIDEQRTTILDVEIPMVTLPLVPGKNLTAICKVIALNQLLKLHGEHPAREFDRRIKDLAAARAAHHHIERGDSE